ncbi:phage tail tape measure protein [Pedobacter cryoconitis]|uniref:TP901 family phage tail tape measure protein n=1 Tax=Pedobacter cryoconitis TaxID=188932 RepID=A0A327SIC3_9SPHI|nr:phage tail tape measure protein [Pedobacter cryoconitis]RAJ28866.1 TP901 family phage tail tape measure protein [Pedobacter cryoconitis]
MGAGSDAMLSLEVIAKMDSLSAGLKTGEKDIIDFVSNGNTALKSLEKTLSDLGIGMSSQGLKSFGNEMKDLKVKAEDSRVAFMKTKAANEELKKATIDATTAVQEQKVVTETNRSSVERAKEATLQYTATLIQQKLTTEQNRTASAAATVAINQLRLANMQNKVAVVAAAGSYAEAQQKLTALGKEIRAAGDVMTGKMNPAVKAMIIQYDKLNDSLKKVDAAMGNHQRNVGDYASAAIKSLAAMAESYISFYTVVSLGKQIIANNAEISDSMSDVQRTAGLTTVEVNALVETLKKIDTRTSLKGLLDIAIIGGQLGIAKEQLGGFTTAVDQLSVSLSGELQGGAEGVAKSLGVLNNVFGVSKAEGGDVEKAFNQIGSVILGLGQSGLATGDFLTDFGERVGGVAAQAGLSLPVLLSYGAVLQENGVSAEVAGTAFKKLIGSIATKREKFLAVAQIADASLTLKEFTNIINTDTQKALELFFNGLAKGGQKTTQFQDLMKSAGMDAARAGQAISALALHQQDLNKHISESTVQYKEGKLSAEQFEIKNDNLAASLSKLGNTITNITTDPNSSTGNFFKRVIEGATTSIKWIDTLADRIQAASDKMIITKVMNGGTPVSSKEEIDAAFKRRRDRSTDDLKDRLTGTGSTKADLMASGKSEIELRKLITIETKKQTEAIGRLNYNLAYIKDPNNVGKPLDDQIAKTNKLRLATFQQEATVNRLKDTYKKLYPPTVVKGEGVDLPGKENKKSAHAFDTVEKQLQDFYNKSNIITKEGLSKDLQEWDDKYNKIKAVIEKLPAGEKKAKASATLETNYTEGKTNIIADNSKQIADFVKKRNDATELIELDGTARTIQNLKNEFAEKIRLSEGNKSAIIALKKQEADEINKVNVDKGIKDQQISALQIAEIVKEHRNTQMAMFDASKNGLDPYGAQIEAQRRALEDLKKLRSDALINQAEYESKSAELSKNTEALINTQAFAENMKSAVESFTVDTVGKFAEGIGQMMASGDMSGFGNEVLSAFGGFLGKMGDLLIQYGIAAQIKAALDKALLVPLGGFIAGAAAIAAGIALKIAAGAFSGLINGGSGGSGGKQQQSPQYGVAHYAMGTNYAPGGVALVGEQGPELVNLPMGSQVVPNHDVMRSINGNANVQVMIPEVRLSGQDIYVSFKRTEKINNRG